MNMKKNDLDSETYVVRGHPRAIWKDEIYTQPNPIIREPIRQFIEELRAQAQKENMPDALSLLEEAIERDSFLWLQMLMFMTKRLGVKFPQLEDLKYE
jgi:acyl carrier protein